MLFQEGPRSGELVGLEALLFDGLGSARGNPFLSDPGLLQPVPLRNQIGNLGGEVQLGAFDDAVLLGEAVDALSQNVALVAVEDMVVMLLELLP